MPSLELTVICSVLPTESTRKIKDAIHKVFGDMEIDTKDGRIVARGGASAAESLIKTIAKEQIAARAYFLFKARRKGNSVVFPLERDPLTVGRISFGEDSAVPPIWVEIRGDVDEILDRLRDIADSS